MKILELIKNSKGNIDLYDISEYKGKTFLDFISDFPPYEIMYTSEDVMGCSSDKKGNSFSLVNEIYIGDDNIPVTNSFCISENGDILSSS